MKKLNHNHLRILNEFRNNSRITFSKIADKYNMPVSKVFNYYHDLREDLDLKHICQINFEASGNPIKRLFFIKTRFKKKESEFLKNLKNTNNLWRLNKNRLLVEGVFKNVDELELFSRKLYNNGLQIIKVNDILKCLKYESFKIPVI